MTITWQMFVAAAFGYGLRELFGLLYRDGINRGRREMLGVQSAPPEDPTR